MVEFNVTGGVGVITYELIGDESPYPGLKSDTLLAAVARLKRERPIGLSKVAPNTHADLETIVMKAIAFEPSARYASAAEFAADIERYLQKRPIEARPPTLGYTLSLFARRHKAATAAADPPDEPPGVRLVSHGLRAGPHARDSVTPFAPNSGVLVLPKMTRPASIQRCTTVACAAAGVDIKAREPADVGSPA